MASFEETNVADSDISESTFPAADDNKEQNNNPGDEKKGEDDPISSQMTTSLEMKERAVEAEQKKKEEKENEAMQTLKRTFIISGVIVAVIGAVCAIAKKYREKRT